MRYSHRVPWSGCSPGGPRLKTCPKKGKKERKKKFCLLVRQRLRLSARANLLAQGETGAESAQCSSFLRQPCLMPSRFAANGVPGSAPALSAGCPVARPWPFIGLCCPPLFAHDRRGLLLMQRTSSISAFFSRPLTYPIERKALPDRRARPAFATVASALTTCLGTTLHTLLSLQARTVPRPRPGDHLVRRSPCPGDGTRVFKVADVLGLRLGSAEEEKSSHACATVPPMAWLWAPQTPCPARPVPPRPTTV